MSKDWQSGLCNCCGAGVIGFLICCSGVECLNYGFAMSTMDEEKSCMVETLKSLCCCACQRGEMRQRYGIAGNAGMDCVCTFCCYPCVGVQMYAEAQKQTGETVI